MRACISQVTTLMNPFEADAASYRGGGWEAVELWLTKLETYVQAHSAAEVRSLFEASGVRPVAAAGQGGLLLSQGAAREAHWDHFRRRLELLRELGVATLVVAADSAANIGRAVDLEDFARAAASLGEAAELAGSFGVRLALEFQKASPICASLETAVALVVAVRQPERGGLPRRVPLPDRPEQARGPRRAPRRADRLGPALRRQRHAARGGGGRRPGPARRRRLPARRRSSTGWRGSATTAIVSLELLNPHLWTIHADRVADMGLRAVRRVLGPWLDESSPSPPAADGPAPAGDRGAGP